jgi:hypothetical protein
MDAAGMFVIFDDYFFDPSALAVGDCFDGATGCLNYSFGNYLFEVFADGLTIGDCTVATDDMNFDSLKAIFR